MELLDIMQAMRLRHSVRAYLDHPMEQDKAAVLRQAIEDMQQSTSLHGFLVMDEPQAFRGPMAHYGSFQGCANYIVITGPKGADEAVGYCGEKLVLLAQQLGLNTCWVALTYKKIPSASEQSFSARKGSSSRCLSLFRTERISCRRKKPSLRS